MEKYDTIITGAGISMATPSNLPKGVAFAKLLWHCLCKRCNKKTLIICEAARAIIFPQDNSISFKRLRLEGLYGVLFRYIPFFEI